MRVSVQNDWQGYTIELNTTLEKLVAKYIFSQDDYQDDGRDITRLMSKTFQANFDRVYENPTEIAFMSSPDNAPKIKTAYQAFITEFQTTGNLSVERAQEICDSINTAFTPITPKSTPTPASPQR